MTADLEGELARLGEAGAGNGGSSRARRARPSQDLITARRADRQPIGPPAHGCEIVSMRLARPKEQRKTRGDHRPHQRPFS